ncbi:hypothetical protein MVEG_07888 [Podila verticillata NRRL 6337]|nr:hypothetical protein MVEG_07888 [Podila verticillata NRRL 6337]
MAGLSLLLLAVVSLASVTVASYSSQYRFTGLVPSDNPKCLFAEDTVKVNYPFTLNDKRDLPLAKFPYAKEKRVYSNRAEHSFPPLELCVVTGPEQECSTKTESECIQDKVEYRIRVNSPIQGYLTVSQSDLVINEDYSRATNFKLIPSNGKVIIQSGSSQKTVLQSLYPAFPIYVHEPTNARKNEDLFTIEPASGDVHVPCH